MYTKDFEKRCKEAKEFEKRCRKPKIVKNEAITKEFITTLEDFEPRRKLKKHYTETQKRHAVANIRHKETIIKHTLQKLDNENCDKKDGLGIPHTYSFDNPLFGEIKVKIDKNNIIIVK